MNPVFKLYGKQPSIELEKEALIIQNQHGLTNAQVSGLLMVFDFFRQLTSFDVPVQTIEVVKYTYSTGKKVEASRTRLPIKTVEFFSRVPKCSDMARYFSGSHGHLEFNRFAKRILKNIKSTKDYIAEGSLEPMNIKFEETSFEVAS